MLTAAILGSGSASAEIYQCGTPSNYFEGYYYDRAVAPGYNDFIGARADLRIRHGAVCDVDSNGNPVTGKYNFTVAWAMIASDVYSSTQGYAQSGFIRWYGSNIYDFAQNNVGNDPTPPTWYGTTALSTGVDRAYKSIYNTACICVISYTDGTSRLMTAFNPYSNWDPPFGPQFMGEARFKQSDMPGTDGARMTMSSMKYQSDTDWNLYDTPCAIFSPVTGGSTRWHHNKVDCVTRQIWTDPLS